MVRSDDGESVVTTNQCSVVEPEADQQRYKRLSGLGLALIDQGMVSGGTFLTNIFIARSVPAETFGTYALYLSYMQLLNSIHGALVIYPLSLLLAGPNTPNKPRMSLWPTLIITTAFASIAGTAGLIAGRLCAGQEISINSVIALVAWQLQEVTRRSLIAQQKLVAASAGDFFGYPLQALLVVLYASSGKLTLNTIFLCMVFTSVAAIVIQTIVLAQENAARAKSLSETASHFWSTGRWNLIGILLGMTSVQGLPAVLSMRFGTASVGKFLSLVNVVGVTHPIMFGISNAGVPKIANQQAMNGTYTASLEGRRFAGWGACIIGIYLLAVMSFPAHALRLFYGDKSAYSGLVIPLEIMCITYIAIYVGQSATMILNGLGLSRSAFRGNYIFAIASVIICLPLSAIFGVSGAVIGSLITNLAKTAFQLSAVSVCFKPSTKHGGQPQTT